MTHTCDLNELRHGVLEVALGKRKPEDLEVTIREGIKAAGSDAETVASLRLLLGEVYYWAKEQDKARRQFRKVLECNPDSVDAMIGIGRTFESSCYGTAQRWFEDACQAAEKNRNLDEQLTALDHLAANAAFRGDTAVVPEIFDRMRRILASDPPLQKLPRMAIDQLVMGDKGHIALPFLNCLIEHLLVKSYSRGHYCLALQSFVFIHGKAGRSDEEIHALIDELGSLIRDEIVARDFNIAAQRAFESWHWWMMQQSAP